MPYLLAAEADKIQDFVFCSSRLREVVGASQLLNRFCKQGVPVLLKSMHGGDPDRDIKVNDGGSFRIVFHGSGDKDKDKQRARAFGADLAELYRLSLGGSLSVAEPVEMNGGFNEANKRANRALRRAKEYHQGAVAVEHMPYVALCSSCGIALAQKYGHLPNEPGDRQRYLCRTCQTKALERWEERQGLLQSFLLKVVGSEDYLDKHALPKDTDTVAGYDLRQRNYVAYLVADGNGMGHVFGECDENQIVKLSNDLTPALQTSLARATGLTNKRLERRSNDKGQEIVPVLPLILGGDDLFALIPAPYALDFARRFCMAYEEKLARLVQDIKLDVARPTVSAAVVICKSKYPYTLARRRAEELMREAKRLGRLLATYGEEPLSTVTFEVILGNRLAGQEEEDEERSRAICPSLRPYWAVDENTGLSSRAREFGTGLHELLNQRLLLKDVPNKRLAELRQAFENLPEDITVKNRNERLQDRTRRLQRLLERSDEGDGLKGDRSRKNALQVLGKALKTGKDHYWRELCRGNGTLLAHGMLDLLETWDFAQDLEQEPEAYEPEESER
jgi:hypothetical protein